MTRYLSLVNPWWENKRVDHGVTRTRYLEKLQKNSDQKLIQILTGLRRVGKSTISLQLIEYFITKKKINPKRILFFSIEEPSLAKLAIIDIINQFRSEFSIQSEEKIIVCIDEIQFRENWQQEIKSLYDSENIKFILTGSSALLLSDKLSLLTGRYSKTQVFPLSFAEFLEFRQIQVAKADEFLLQKHLEDFLLTGGMPEYVLQPTDRYLETTVESILFKDLVSKFNIRNPRILTDLLYLLSDRVGTTTSSLKLAKLLEINKDSVLTYLQYLNQTFITAELPNFSHSRNKEIYNPPKIYFEDTGICSKYSSKSNMGALVENAIYSHLKQHTFELQRIKLGYWYESKSEIDFVLSQNAQTYFIESKWVDEVEQIDFGSLRIALVANKNPKKILYITKTLQGKTEVDEHVVEFIPAYKFLRSNLDAFIVTK